MAVFEIQRKTPRPDDHILDKFRLRRTPRDGEVDNRWKLNRVFLVLCADVGPAMGAFGFLLFRCVSLLLLVFSGRQIADPIVVDMIVGFFIHIHYRQGGLILPLGNEQILSRPP